VSSSFSARRNASGADVNVRSPAIEAISSSRSSRARSASASSRKYDDGLLSFFAMCSSERIAGRILPSSIALTCARVKYGAPSCAWDMPSAIRASRNRSPSFFNAGESGAGRRRRVRIAGMPRR